ncbi:Crp/Fnr family transcriptional regulator [Haliangium sp.]|uniref:Crp/Fnr family transcriptional regulator n=1 Tax=Haliangium sp. TaxID=2663208 RepID=UPI003D12BB3C
MIFSTEHATSTEYAVKEYPSGSVIFEQGEVGRAVYFVESGTVEIRRRTHGHDHILAVLGEGEFFGEMALINARTRSATAVVRKDARLRVVSAEFFTAMLERQGEFAGQLIRTLADRLDNANRQVDLFVSDHPAHRMVHSLCLAVNEQIHKGEGGRGAVYIPYTLGDLAERADVSWGQAVDVVERLAAHGLIIPACAADIDARGYVVAESELLIEFLHEHKPGIGRTRPEHWHGAVMGEGHDRRGDVGAHELN